MSRFICGRYTLDLSRSLVMGILNVTPDSFSDGGRHDTVAQAVAHARALIADGADILDIGGESTRPGAPFVSPEEELCRVMPVLRELVHLNVPLSLDTRRTSVMQAALAGGLVDLINDVSALEDEGALPLLAAANVGICLMHKQGNPDTMQQQPSYHSVVDEVGSYLARRVRLCLDAGIDRARLLADPGFGFGKTLEHNLALLRALPQLEQQAGVSLLVGLSRKSMLGAITGESRADQRLGASIAAAVLSAQQGARVIRVHDVKETVQALQVLRALHGVR
ncbi:dihydropteroate synthase [Vogesella sp. DC21W]|uniref:Dihydropteroate synthase n=1 Tax=Vogesella aquatica TaxID=2984206 RepID=A0ABT5IZQ9_9NEIS|nr:dihydropteroate synthase [Vogesella aquatica]MDC7717079.1 dihydropteroate synthase [Vogesella aquatica]